MKRYLIFAVLGPFIGGFLLLFVTTYQSGYWEHTSLAEVGKLLIVFVKTLQYAYLFGIVPSLLIASIDDILYHVRRIGPLVRMLMVGAGAFGAATLLYSSRGPDSGGVQVFLYGLVGLVPAALSSWLVHRYVDKPQPVAKA